MVNDMLDITKIERNDFIMNRTEVNIQHIIGSVANDLESYAKQHEITVSIADLARDIVIYGDEMRLRQVFQNLMDNSIKYGKRRGHLTVSSKNLDSTVELTFVDDGIGIPQNEQSKIFDRFYRASNTSKSSSSGSGLGLYIVEAIIKQHNGDIQFTSIEGEGTTFIVTLPLAKEATKSKKENKGKEA